jgi:hypothetical protein
VVAITAIGGVKMSYWRKILLFVISRSRWWRVMLLLIAINLLHPPRGMLLLVAGGAMLVFFGLYLLW